MKAQNCDLPLKIDDITVTGSNASEFEIRKPLWCNSGISGNTSYSYCRFKLIFNAAKPAGIKDAKLEIAFNDTSTKTVPIKAKAIVEPPNPKIDVEPTDHHFGNVVIGTSSSPYQFTVKNTGNVPLRIFSRLREGNADNFSSRDNCRRLRSLSPGKTCSIYASFNPKYPEGKKWTDLIIYYYMPLNGVISITPPHVKVRLTGMAIKPVPCTDASITIETRQSGRWSDPRTWYRIRPPIDSLTTPNADDVVRINAKHTVKAYQPFLKKVKSL
jgi:hypothetical protein